jgi:hypothetical protein
VTPPSRLSTVFSEKHSRQDQISHQVCGFQGCAFSCLALAEMRRHKKEEHRGKKASPVTSVKSPFPISPRLVAHKRKVHNSLLLKYWGEEDIIDFFKDHESGPF